MTRRCRSWCALIVAVPMASIASVASGAATVASPATPASTQSETRAAEQLALMARYLASLPGFEVELVTSYDAVQESGQKIEFSEVRRVLLARPDRLRVDQRRSDGTADMILFDGQRMTVFDGREGVYAQAAQPGSLDDAVVYFVRELGMQLPLAALLSTRFPAELERLVKTVDYVELTEILPVPAHHIAGRTSSADFQVWIAAGDQPLPLRIVLTYINEPGQPQFRAQFLNWKSTTPTDPGIFAFTPTGESRQIVFAVQVPAVADAVPAAPSDDVEAKP